MTYSYENLGPERFQHLCQALLVRAFPDMQCLPVNQSDGGRDAFVRALHPDQTFIVFQAKYFEKALTEPEPHRWLRGVVDAEAPKVADLVRRGAARYYLLTNVRGTAPLATGAVDTVQTMLDDALTIPASCWWRDDLDRRLDDAFDVKWSFPDVMSGLDVIRTLIEEGLSSDQERRSGAVRAFVKSQFVEDREVRFKQVELQNDLLDLFIDVPASLALERLSRREQSGDLHALQTLAQQVGHEPDPRFAHGFDQWAWHHSAEDYALGAATLLLDSTIQSRVPLMLLEGAPGQGKSTLAQYICQVHRMRMLDEHEMVGRVPAVHTTSRLRLPFRVDLRDFATWVQKRNPFAMDEDVPKGWHRSLDAFLAALVAHSAGGATFSVDDLHAVVRLLPVLIVLDGLDEVADIDARRDVVQEVVAGANRLDDVCESLQMVVTSRPAAFANAPQFPETTFRRATLVSITPSLIADYADRWVKARKLNQREARTVKKVLLEKLDQPHMRDLARNPMQLAILLSLIYTRGSSLPDKRTALYDAYIDLFFSRESEKNVIVREHRDLLIDVHRYLAWLLHSQAEVGRNRGSVSSDELTSVLEKYLEAEGHDPRLLDSLFTGMVERVVALVSRVEGTYEFEVQPLREYFAARHLYETAPYSPPGGERRGTKPDRFDALARDFYWLNVTRFYAGCFSKGELAGLAERIEELARAEGYRLTSYPRMLSGMLLADWVFAQSPNTMAKVVALLLDDLGVRHALNADAIYGSATAVLALPDKCGREELADRCINLLRGAPRSDYAHAVARILRANSPRGELDERWLDEVRVAKGSQRTAWMRYGLWVGVLGDADLQDIEELMADRPLDPERLRILLDARRVGYFDAENARFEAAIALALDDQASHGIKNTSPLSLIGALHLVLDPGSYAAVFRLENGRTFREALQRLNPVRAVPEAAFAAHSTYRKREDVLSLVRAFGTMADEPLAVWRTSLGVWERVLEPASEVWGERWALREIGTIAAGIRSKSETGQRAEDLFDPSLSLAQRIRYARLRAGSAAWWRATLESARSREDRLFGLMVAATWASRAVIARLKDEFSDYCETLLETEFERLVIAVRRCTAIMADGTTRGLRIDSGLIKGLSPRAAALLAERVPRRERQKLISVLVEKAKTSSDAQVLGSAVESAMQAASSDPAEWPRVLELVERSYAHGVSPTDFGLYYLHGRGESLMSLDTAREIAANPHKYPLGLVAVAEEECRSDIAKSVIPVARTAKEERWFEIDPAS